MDIARYLERLHYSGDTTPNVSTLRALHRAHMLSVPFENLNIMLKRPLDLDTDVLYHKIVECQRGGFCYELNGLFASLLRELGYQVDLLSARVWMGEGFSQEFDHLTLLVHLEQDWLADVGFGDCFMEPLRFVANEEQTVSNGTFRLVPQEENRWMLQVKRDNGEWSPEYLFSMTPYTLKDFEEMCVWQQTSPDSHFTKRRICSRATEQGRVTLSEGKLILTNQGQREEIPLPDENAVTAALRDHFIVDLDLL
jgi:N-hydroxyarylamine O-acetyltransferase